MKDCGYSAASHVFYICAIVVLLCESMDLTKYDNVDISHECDGITQEILPCRFVTVIAG